MLRTRGSEENLLAARPVEQAKKRLRVINSMALDEAPSLHALMKSALPDKEHLFPQWLAALTAPAVSITNIEDVKRLDPEDIVSLPVPPLVKGVFRDVLLREEQKRQQQQAVLIATKERQRDFLAPLRDRNMQPPVAGSRYFQDLKNYRLILTREEIEAGVRILARRIETWCKGERIILVGILKGVFMLMSDLCRELVRPYSVYFVEASSYKDEKKQGECEINADLSCGKFFDKTTKLPHKVVLVDELLDNGKTLSEMKAHLLKKLSATHTEKDILTVCLFSKKRERDWPEADITGITDLPDLWVVGYGLDDRGTKRGWPELFAIPKVKIVETIEQSEVETLLKHLDDSAILNDSINFADLDLPCDPQKRYRVAGFDALGFTGGPVGETPMSRPTKITKADILKSLAEVSIVKGKYEHELRFAFILENVQLVPEDDIFSGNNTVFSEMRMRLRKQINSNSRRFGLEGLEDITAK